MNPSSRRLCFTVGTGLLTASLSLTTGCKKNTVNVAPPADDPHVNVAAEGPDEDPPADEPAADEDGASDAVESPDAEGEGEAGSPE